MSVQLESLKSSEGVVRSVSEYDYKYTTNPVPNIPSLTSLLAWPLRPEQLARHIMPRLQDQLEVLLFRKKPNIHLIQTCTLSYHHHTSLHSPLPCPSRFPSLYPSSHTLHHTLSYSLHPSQLLTPFITPFLVHLPPSRTLTPITTPSHGPCVSPSPSPATDA